MENSGNSTRYIISGMFSPPTLGKNHAPNQQNHMQQVNIQAAGLVREPGFWDQSSSCLCQEAFMGTECKLLPCLVQEWIDVHWKIHFLPVAKELLNLCLASMEMNIPRKSPELLTFLSSWQYWRSYFLSWAGFLLIFPHSPGAGDKVPLQPPTMTSKALRDRHDQSLFLWHSWAWMPCHLGKKGL